ncbi:Uncharacterised protein [Dorea longicatena]|jgi:hypothetical protein|uniref:Uncharacterized protein n=1 Tax=Dorea longicatena TaxID=88431 RepID=A0A173RD88_9FIRM|nr:hypothetical protein [Dorea longicatena]CUM75328.1 Uncharacterised protein [Dorea longicatena]
MEYVQLNLDDWVQMKQKLRQELIGVKQSFVRIGYALRQIDDQKLYERDGYKSIAEFARAEYGLGKSITSRFMSINKEYSIDGYSERLRPEYAELGRSQLEEMLKLPDSDRQMIQPETSREDIRELKRFNKTEPAAGEADDLRQVIEKFYYDNPGILNTVFSGEFDEARISKFSEIVNPAGNRSYKKGLYFMMMYENRVTFKKFGSAPENMTWWEFYQMTVNIFGEMAAGSETWKNYFGEENDEGDHEDITDDGTRACEKIPDGTKTADTETDETREEKPGLSDEKSNICDGEKTGEETNRTEDESPAEESSEKGVAPAQKSAETSVKTGAEGGKKDGDKSAESSTKQEEPQTKEKEPEKTEETPEVKPEFQQENTDETQIPGQTELVKDFPQYCPPDMNAPEQQDQSEVKPAYATRRLYLSSIDADTAAEYMGKAMEKAIRNMPGVSFGVLTKESFWKEFFETEVDRNGDEIECVN